MRGRHGKYDIARKLAAGGMAQLYLGTVVGQPGSIVAIKQVLPEHADDSEFQTMFLDEIRIASTLDHPNIVKTLDLGAHQNGFFLVMEYLHGHTLRELMRVRAKGGGGLELGQALTIARGVAAGLRYAHDHADSDGRPLHVVHRDVSPANVFLTWSGGVKLLDFGIAKAGSRRSETVAGTLKGKIPYMSPEQCLGENLDRRSDVYSLGVLLYEMTTSGRLVKPGADFAMMSQIVSGTFDPPRQLVPGYPADLEAIVMKCLARRRTQRYQSAGHLLAELEAFCARRRIADAPQHVIAALTARWDPPRSEPTAEDPEPQPEESERSHPSRPPPAPPPRIAPRVESVTRGDLTVVTLRGRLTEQFEGTRVGRGLIGQVVLDVAGVERITSYGVREWLQMMASVPAESRIWLFRCPEPVVNQLTLIRGFEKPAKVLSFEAPYVCRGCGQAFRATLDTWTHREALETGVPPVVRCGSCGGEGGYDDDPAAFVAIASTVDPNPPAALRELGVPETRAGRVDKHVDGRVTRLVLIGDLAPTVRWRSAAEGLEGEVVVDLSGASAVHASGVPPLLAALRSTASGTERVTVVGASTELAAALAADPVPRVEVASVRLDGRCPACHKALGLVPVAATGRCPWCAADLHPPPPIPPPPPAKVRLWPWLLLAAGVGAVIGVAGLSVLAAVVWELTGSP